jgi:hypothetical protein
MDEARTKKRRDGELRHGASAVRECVRSCSVGIIVVISPMEAHDHHVPLSLNHGASGLLAASRRQNEARPRTVAENNKESTSRKTKILRPRPFSTIESVGFAIRMIPLLGAPSLQRGIKHCLVEKRQKAVDGWPAAARDAGIEILSDRKRLREATGVLSDEQWAEKLEGCEGKVFEKVGVLGIDSAAF